MKTCLKCGLEKPLEAFFRDKNKLDGRRNTCKDCGKSTRQRHYQENKETIDKKNEQWRKDNHEQSLKIQKKSRNRRAEQEKQRHKDYYWKDIDKTHKRDAEKRKRNRENLREYHQRYQKEYRKNNPNKYRINKEKRLSRIKSNGIFLIYEKEIIKILSMPCQNCGTKKSITLDHIIPISRGGRHSIGNLQALCFSCNSSKNNKLPIEWKIYQRNLVQ